MSGYPPLRYQTDLLSGKPLGWGNSLRLLSVVLVHLNGYIHI